MALAGAQADAELTASSTRPSSSWTANSLFADSAISVQTPVPVQKEENPLDADDLMEDPEIAGRLNGLVAEIWACEQDGTLRGEKRRRLAKAVAEVEIALAVDFSAEEGREISTIDEPGASETPKSATPIVRESDLEMIQSGLASTVKSMRMRQQEQRHLHQLAIEKLEAVAQRCIEQEKRMRDYAREMARLREDNQILSQENQVLHIQLSEAQAECARKDTAVKAMSSAVSGLEGYVNSSPSPVRSAGTRRIVTRGKGRFRGRYYAEEPVEAPVGYGPDGSPDAKVLHDGVTAWLRGFRDVEEELRSIHGAPRLSGSRPARIAPKKITEDDWGDFVTATDV
jgi:hypothetical protein